MQGVEDRKSHFILLRKWAATRTALVDVIGSYEVVRSNTPPEAFSFLETSVYSLRI